ncbi:plasmid mobilization protein [Burkholderia vietnamiensis]|uniref:plasmid mobilization protein n=1 Tax=Burkholderia vietnamiensis TaxID=60552 RepID=UPI001CF536F2|nr:plasmid mobilization relaxosome protein MobC [Burkholderia vietnamiensis]MCA8292056.1 MobC family plasmid mobilization relaxosome protein [Burkholderia vietnamiensis]HDR9165939.1 plasmid mobilization relaxosome protein MobC [Burkholderia vietnamiensis]HDR9172654.1 plasmid mobilization relaxosome protein MobC [Burkholderia vietnamiensis]
MDDEARRRRGRKGQPVPDLRSHTVSVRMNEIELARLDTWRSTVSMQRGEYLRAAAFETLPTPIPELNREAWADLARVGANLNQIAKQLNEGSRLAEMAGETLTVLRELRQALIGAQHSLAVPGDGDR